jgi:hypothetical protein
VQRGVWRKVWRMLVSRTPVVTGATEERALTAAPKFYTSVPRAGEGKKPMSLGSLEFHPASVAAVASKASITTSGGGRVHIVHKLVTPICSYVFVSGSARLPRPTAALGIVALLV